MRALGIFALFIISIYAPFAATAQNELWDSYISRVDNKPATILVDMSLVLRAPDAHYPYLLITGPQTSNVSKNGIPSAAVIEELEQVLDATDNFLTGVTAKVLAGTVTYNGQRNNYYYVKDTNNIRAALARMYNRNFKTYRYSLTIKQDPQWLTYRTFLYPDDTTQNWMDNNKVITELLKKGDTLSKPRTLTYAACFESDTARSGFAAFATGHGFNIERLHTIKTGSMPQCITFSKPEVIMPADSLNRNTLMIRTEVRARKGYYSGWSVKGE